MTEINSNAGKAEENTAETNQTVFTEDFINKIELPAALADRFKDVNGAPDSKGQLDFKKNLLQNLYANGEISENLEKISEATSNYPSDDSKKFEDRMQMADNVMSNYYSVDIHIKLTNMGPDDFRELLSNTLPEEYKGIANNVTARTEIRNKLSDKDPINKKIDKLNTSIETLNSNSNGETIKELKLSEDNDKKKKELHGTYGLYSSASVKKEKGTFNLPDIEWRNNYTKKKLSAKIFPKLYENNACLNPNTTGSGFKTVRKGEITLPKFSQELSGDNFITPLVANIETFNTNEEIALAQKTQEQEQINLAKKTKQNQEIEARMAQAKEKAMTNSQNRLDAREGFNGHINNKLLALQGRQVEGEQKAPNETARTPQKDSENIALNDSRINKTIAFNNGR